MTEQYSKVFPFFSKANANVCRGLIWYYYVTHSKLHFGIEIIIIYAELVVCGEDMKQLPFSLDHEHTLVVHYFLRGSH